MKWQTSLITNSPVLVEPGVDLNPEDDNLEPADLAGSLTNFGTAQNQDPTLQQARAEVQVVDGTPINDGMMPNSFPHFIMKRVWCTEPQK